MDLTKEEYDILKTILNDLVTVTVDTLVSLGLKYSIETKEWNFPSNMTTEEINKAQISIDLNKTSNALLDKIKNKEIFTKEDKHQLSAAVGTQMVTILRQIEAGQNALKDLENLLNKLK